MTQPQNLTVLGDGAFGTAFATLLAHNGHTVTLWCYNSSVALGINEQRTNSTYLPGVSLPTSIVATNDLAEALRNDIIFEAIPVQCMRSVLQKCTPHARPEQRWVVLSKGIENETLLLPTEIIKNTIHKDAHTAVVTGPSYARELAEQQPTGFCVATTTKELNDEISALLRNDYVTCVPSDDCVGAQIVAALKNVVAIGIGLLEGAKFGVNTQALFLMQMLDEQKAILAFVNADAATLYGIAGIGDLVLTCFGAKSRNHAVGKMIGEGKKLDAVLSEMNALPEGVNTLRSLKKLITKTSLSLPVTAALHGVIVSGGDAKSVVNAVLMPSLS